ncbi:MAG TPA: glycosyltransferase family 39 protein [Anaerolineales bacterium]
METDQPTLFSPLARRWIYSHHQLILTLIVLAGIAACARSLTGHTIVDRQLDSSPWTIAAHLMHGQGYTACSTDYFPLCKPGQPTAMREPVPVFMLAAAMSVLPSPLSAVLLEMGLYLAVICLLYFALARENKLLALAAAAFWAVSVPVMEEIGDASGDLEGAFWVLIGILLFQRARRTRRVMDWILAGMVMGLAALSRSVLLAGALLLVIGILLEGSSATMRTRFKWAVAYGLALCPVLAPWVVRNQIVFGVPSLGSSLTGYNLFRQSYYAGSLQVPPHFVGSKEGEPVVKALVQSAPPPVRSNELRMQSFYTRAALRDILGHPFRYVELSAFRFVSLWFNSTVKAAYGERTGKLDIAQLIQQIFFLCAALVGAWKHRKWLWPMSLAVLGVTMAYILVIGQIRYLVEVMPLLAILAASSFLPASTQQEHQALALEVR